MRTDSYCYMRAGIISLLLMVVFTALSCGGSGGGGTVGLSAQNSGPGALPSDVQKGTAILITEDEIATLPAWQQELLSDPGWNQPYIEPRAKTEIEPPTPEMLMEDYNRVLEEGIRYGLHGQSSGKSASYMDQQGFGLESLLKGEYDLQPRNVDPPYGCNSDGGNGSGTNAFDDVIREGTQHLSEVISYVLEATTTVNWFNTTGGAGNDAQSAVYQLFATHREANPEEWLDPDVTAEFEELCYRADLAPGVAPGGDCSDAEAFLVGGMFWKRFNSITIALPNLEETELFNLLVAPASEVSDLETSGTADGRYQEYYFGTVGDCYGNAMIVGLEFADSGCEIFDNSVNGAFAADDPYHYTPVYGVILKRWQQAELGGMAGPWESWLGWPVWGPKAYANGAQMLTPRGAYYAWGVWFERGFMWWIDYDQTAYPNTPDEAQVFTWNGDNVFCYTAAGLLYSELAPTVYYGGGGALGVSVVVDSFRNLGTDPWQPVALDATGTYYEIALQDSDSNPSGTETVNVALHAHAYGGVPNADCSYDWYVWAFRDGTIGMGDEDAAQYLNHTYGNTLRNMEQVYIVRVQVTDSEGTLGYGDSLPIHLGHGGAAPPGEAEVWVIRNDGGNYDANYDALTDDLTTLGASWAAKDYASDIADQFDAAGAARVAIWYRGGPGNASETQTYTTAWTNEQIDNYIQLLEDDHPVLMMGQANGYARGAYFPSTYACGWEVWWGYMVVSAQLTAGQERHMWAHGMTGGKGMGGTGSFGYLASEPFGLDIVGPIGGKGPSDGYDMDGINCAERYNGAGSSGDIPITYDFGSNLQCSGLGFYGGFMQFHVYPVAALSFTAGVNNSPAFEGLYDLGFLSWGNTRAPNRNMGVFTSSAPVINVTDQGSSRVWVVGYPWAVTGVPSSANGGMTRDMLLMNILGWLDDGLTYTGGGSGGGEAGAGSFAEYDGNPEIIQMMVGNWEAGGFHRQTISMTWDGTAGNFPDQNANAGYDVNVYRTTAPGSGNYVVTTSPNNDWVNGNDIDFQFPWYAYIVDVGNDGVEIGEGNLDDDTVFFAGLLLRDANNTWTRDLSLYHYNQNTLNPDENVPSCVIDGFSPPVHVAGYYTALTPDTGDEVRAYYGAEPASVTIDNMNEITAECVAHWPESLVYGGFEYPTGSGFTLPVSDPVLYWSMYPGQNMLVPGTFNEIPRDVAEGWEVYRHTFDIDPAVSIPARDGTGPLDADIWNKPQFAYTDTTNSGRVVTFNYRSCIGWNGDLNRDGVIDGMDKYPVRVRLFTDHEDFLKWPTGWPNHLADAGLNPATGGPVWDPLDPGYNIPDFIEGGAYIIDEGDAVYPLQIGDDPATVDPDETVEGGSNDYTVIFGYFIQYGNPNYVVDLQMGFDYADIGPGEGVLDAFGDSGETQYGAATHTSSGTFSTMMHVTTIPDGDYYAAIRVTDANGTGDRAVYVWPGICPLWPGTAWAVIDDTPYSCPPQMQADLETIWGGTVPLIQSSAVGSTTLADYSLVFWICGYNTSPSELTSTERTYLMDYMDDGGNVVLWVVIDTRFYSYDSGNYQLNYVGFNRTSGFNHTGGGGYMVFPLAGSGVPTSPIRDGPGGNGLTELRCWTGGGSPYSSYGLIPPTYVTTADKWSSWPFDNPTYWGSYITGLHKDNNGAVEGGHHVWLGIHYYNSQAYMGTSSTSNVNFLKNLIDAIDPAQLP